MRSNDETVGDEAAAEPVTKLARVGGHDAQEKHSDGMIDDDGQRSTIAAATPQLIGATVSSSYLFARLVAPQNQGLSSTESVSRLLAQRSGLSSTESVSRLLAQRSGLSDGMIDDGGERSTIAAAAPSSSSSHLLAGLLAPQNPGLSSNESVAA